MQDLTIELIKPSSYAPEGPVTSNIRHNKRANCVTTIGRSNSSKSLLSDGVPNLSLHLLADDFHSLCLKTQKNSGLRVYVEVISRIPRQ